MCGETTVLQKRFTRATSASAIFSSSKRSRVYPGLGDIDRALVAGFLSALQAFSYEVVESGSEGFQIDYGKRVLTIVVGHHTMSPPWVVISPRFGGRLLQIGVRIEPQFGFTYDRIHEIVGHALLTGFSVLWSSDHFVPNEDATDRVLFNPWLTMVALVRDVNDIRVGTLVAYNSYHNPALHAKMAATLDVVSEERLEFGMGAGWKEIEYRVCGYEFPPRESQDRTACRGDSDHSRCTVGGEVHIPR
ncbi:MAG: LLM class flavin-dependent oxidoreductase [Candidatus Thorarchaeota archaeon]